MCWSGLVGERGVWGDTWAGVGGNSGPMVGVGGSVVDSGSRWLCNVVGVGVVGVGFGGGGTMG